jgi:adenylosuccinate lyase
MGELWESDRRFANMLRVEVAVAEAQAELGIIPKEAAESIAKNGKFELDRILEIERTTRHDVIAFVSNVAENVGPWGRYVHFALTSSDVLDTAMSLQVVEAARVLEISIDRLHQALRVQINKHRHTLCSGRTHGMHAEPTSFGLKLAGFEAELKRNHKRFQRAVAQMSIGKLSGAVGTYSAQSREVEAQVCKRLGLQQEVVATQVIPRDRHAELFSVMAFLGNGLERLAVELRHLQRTEVSEVYEGFTAGQKGSSAMPHKKNPISSENLTGVARLLRGYSQAAMENVALWHERDISHSSVERVILPDAFIILDYALDRMAQVIENLQVDEERMLSNMDLSNGQLFSSHILLALVEKGLTREKAYELVQRVSHELNQSDHLRDKLLSDSEIAKVLGPEDLMAIFSGRRHLAKVDELIDQVLTERE